MGHANIMSSNRSQTQNVYYAILFISISKTGKITCGVGHQDRISLLWGIVNGRGPEEVLAVLIMFST